VQRVKKEKRPGEISPEEGSQFYQPERPESQKQKKKEEKEYEEVTRTYKNDEFFAQVLKQGKSPKSQGRRLAVTGEAGAGKTTLLQKIAQWVAAETEQDVAIWVSLADLQGRSVEEYLLQKWLKDALRAVRITPEMEEALASLFNSGRVWLLLDGVDEMGSDNPLETVKNQISGWVASARVVVTCRQNVWDAGKNALEGFDVYRNLDFDYPEGVGQFIHRWFAPHPDSGERLLAELAQGGKERIRDTVRNPLRLALLCRAWQIRQGSLPETKAGLYGQFAKALYEWKQEKFRTTEDEQEELNAALGRLALRGMEQSESRFRLKESLVREVLGKKDQPPFSLALQLGWLNLVGVALENPDERVYAFYHPTFQEYFVALAVDDWGYFFHHVPDNPSVGTYRIFEKQWKEVILLWFGRENVEKEKKEAFIDKLVNFDDGCGSWNYQKVDKGFYEYQAYFFSGSIVPEFKDSRFADAIVSQIVKSCVSALDSIKTGANAVLAETDRKRAINRLIQLLDDTSDKSTFFNVDYTLSKIATGNEQAINRLIRRLDETFDENIRVIVAYILGKIAVANEPVINRLIQLFDETSHYNTRSRFAYVLGEIAVGNEPAINRLIRLLDEIFDESNHWSIARSLGTIAAMGNKEAIYLIQLLDETSDYDLDYNLRSIRWGVADILGKIAVGNEPTINRYIRLLDETSDYRIKAAFTLGKIAAGNEQVINRLIQLLEQNSDESLPSVAVAWSLGKIAVGNEQVINRLIQLLEQTSDESTRRRVAEILGDLAVGNEQVINRLIQLLDETSDDNTRSSVAWILGNIAVGNESAINRFIQLLDKTSDESTRRSVAEILGKIAVENESAINRLIQLLDETSDEYTRRIVADSLGKIAVENESAINRLIQLLDETSDDNTRRSVAEILGKIIENKQQYYQIFFPLTHNLTDEIYPNKFDLYETSYKLIWQCAQNLTYPEFYTAWHYQLTSTHPEAPDNIPVGNTLLTQSLETQINDILSQLQPTPQTYPLPINIQSLADETDTSGISQELCNLIYSLALPDTDIPPVSNFAQLKQQILTAKRQLQKLNLALIFHDCKPHPPLLTCCRKIADAKLGLHILWITDEPLEAPLRGFPPSQDNLLGALQSWLEEC
jgi:HEAT repeat protein/energy-coupling factor transporter ATP-binding protein EcfA2